MNEAVESNGKILNGILLVFVFMLIAATAALLLPAWYKYRAARMEECRQQAALDDAKKAREETYRKKIRLENSPAEVEKVARKKYNFVKKGEIIMRYPENPESTGKRGSKALSPNKGR